MEPGQGTGSLIDLFPAQWRRRDSGRRHSRSRGALLDPGLLGLTASNRRASRPEGYDGGKRPHAEPDPSAFYLTHVSENARNAVLFCTGPRITG